MSQTEAIEAIDPIVREVLAEFIRVTQHATATITQQNHYWTCRWSGCYDSLEIFLRRIQGNLDYVLRISYISSSRPSEEGYIDPNDVADLECVLSEYTGMLVLTF